MKTARIPFDLVNDKTPAPTPEAELLPFIVQQLQTKLYYAGFDFRNPVSFYIDERNRELVFTQQS